MNIGEFLYKLENPQVYTGKEINVVRKKRKPDLINICLVFPDKYEIGMSHYGIKILYHILNNIENVYAERCFLPNKESIKTFKTHNFSLFSLETKTPLKNFDLIGFSLLSELNYTNILKILELSQVPLKTKDRKNIFPIIAAGGISSVNPEPLREFIDIFAIGDGEKIFPDIIDALLKSKTKTLNKKALLNLFNKIEGIYVPSLFQHQRKGKFFLPDLKSRRIKKRIIKNFNVLFPEKKVIVPITNVVFNRLNVEIARGCLQNCRFCQAKSYYSPYRPKSPKKVSTFIKNALKKTGFESFSLSSLSSGDYPFLKELLEIIPDIITPNTSFSVSSLRPSTLSKDLLKTISLFRRTGITIVPEAGSERLRRIINKNVTDKEIFEAIKLALKYKWQKIKLYFMIGLPSETKKDIDSIVELIKGIVKLVNAKKNKIKIHISFSSFVPKPHTPLQWARSENLETIFTKVNYIKEKIKKYKNVDLDFHKPSKGVVETILTRGDCRVGELILKAFKKGEIYSAWDSDFNYSIWEELINKLDLKEFLKEIPLDEPLPWDFIDVNFKKEYLTNEYQKAMSETPTPSCYDMECKDCKGCFFGLKKEKDLKSDIIHKYTSKRKKNLNFNRVRIFYEKKGDFRFFSHLSIIKYIERLIRKSGIYFKETEGFHPRMKISFLPPIPVFAQGVSEVLELFLDANLNENKIIKLLNSTSFDFKFKRVKICNKSPNLSKDIHFMEYDITVNNLQSSIKKIKKYLADTDSMFLTNNKLSLKMDYSNNGQERFSKIYKILDPGKKLTSNLTRKNVTFKNDL